MTESAYQFVEIATIFPFILVFLLAGILAFMGFGLVLFIHGLTSKTGGAPKIIRIIIGAILLIIAIFMSIFLIIGFMELGVRGGAINDRRNVNAEAMILINYLSTIL